MKIKKLKLESFKKFQNKEFEFKDKNEIYGKNGEGKSTIKDAIFFCLYGRTSNGSLADTTRFIKDGEVKCSVTVEIEKNGTHVIRRERSIKGTRLSYMDGSQSEEDSVITQRDLDSLVPDYELFQAVFNVGSFMSLPDKDKREFLLKLTPEIDKRLLYLELGGQELLIDKYRFNFNDIDSTHKNLLRINRENNEELIRTKAVIDDSKEIEIPEITVKSQADKLKKIQELRVKKNSIDIKWDIYNGEIDLIERIIKQNDGIIEQINNIKIEECQEPSNELLNKLIQQRNELKQKISIPEGKCPTCLQDILESHKNKVNEVNNIRVRKIAENEALLAEETKKYNEEMARYKKYIQAKATKQLLNDKLQAIPESPQEPEPCFEIDTEEEREINRIQRQYIQELGKRNLLKKQEIERIKKIEELKIKMESLVGDINEVNKLLPIFSPSGIPSLEMKKKIDPIIENIKKFIPTIKIETIEHLKSGLSTKEVFNLYANNIEYRKMSLGEKVKIDIAMSQVINEMTDNSVGSHFLDNSEVLDDIPEIKNQSFICKVTQDKLKLL